MLNAEHPVVLRMEGMMPHRPELGFLPLVFGTLLINPVANAAELGLKRVVLSTGGVGYFEYEAEVSGGETPALDVPLDQMDDVLKSLAVYDVAGSVGEITLPAREPLAQNFADLPFDRGALNSEVDLLNALQGAEIRVAAPKAVSGRLVHVDRATVSGPNETSETRSRVSVLTDQGLRQFVLHDVDAIAFADAGSQEQVGTALQRIASHRAAGRRQLTLRMHGTGARTLRVGLANTRVRSPGRGERLNFRHRPVSAEIRHRLDLAEFR
jgi:hypothetical protein